MKTKLVDEGALVPLIELTQHPDTSIQLSAFKTLKSLSKRGNYSFEWICLYLRASLFIEENRWQIIEAGVLQLFLKSFEENPSTEVHKINMKTLLALAKKGKIVINQLF
jgi:hypothetical protein